MKLPDPPAWIPRDAWDGYVEMRSGKKGAAIRTLRTYQLCIRKLEQFKELGYDVGAILDRSTEMCWTGLFEPEVKTCVGDRNGRINRKEQIFAEFLSDDGELELGRTKAKAAHC